MATYAHYFIWVGIQKKDLDEVDKDNSFVDQILYGADPVGVDGLTFETIYMHGEVVGGGVKVLDLDWRTASEGPTEYEMSVSTRAFTILDKVREILLKNKVVTEANMYHHIDLGT